MKVKVSYQPREWQKEVHLGLEEHPLNSFIVVKSKRQCGKSVMLENILLKAACTNAKSVSIALSPTLEQARKMFSEIQQAIITTPLYKKSNEQRLYMQLWNDSEIYFKSAEQGEALRGYTVKKGGVLVIDEAAYISDNIFYTVLPWVNVSKAPVVIVSTPKFKTGFFYDFYNAACEGDERTFCYDWSNFDTSEFLSNDMLEMYRKQVPRQQFLTDYMGLFLDMEGSVFGNFESVLNGKYESGLSTYMGIDWGTGSNGDYTAISVFNSKKQMVDLKYFNDKDSTDTIREIINIIKKWKPLKVNVEKNSIGSVYFDLLKKEAQKEHITSTSIVSFNTSNESKHDLVAMLQVAIQNSEIQLFNDLELVTELTQYECKPSPTGKPTYNAAKGYHDDILMSIMLALYAMKINNSSVRFG